MPVVPFVGAPSAGSEPANEQPMSEDPEMSAAGSDSPSEAPPTTAPLAPAPLEMAPVEMAPVEMAPLAPSPLEMAGVEPDPAPSPAATPDAGVPSGPRPLTPLPFDLTGIIGTGQSLSVGEQAAQVITRTQPFQNLKLALPGNVLPFNPNAAGLSLVPLVEPLRAFASTYPSAYPENIYGETPHTAMANQISALAQSELGSSYSSVHSVVGENGQPMAVLRKGAREVVAGATSMGRAYAATLYEVAAITRLARAQGRTYGVAAIVITHGEADASKADYENDLFQLWTDYDTDLRNLTGQAQRLLMLVSQQHAVPNGVGARSASTQAQWRAGVDHAAEIVCSGPKYQYGYAADHVHLTAPGYQLLGEKYGQVYFERVVLGNAWRPLEPLGVTRNGRLLSVRFHVPVLPLVFDTALPAPHQLAGSSEWAQGRGFELRQGNRRVGIQSVTIAGDTVQVTSAEDLNGGNYTLGYAATDDNVPMPGGTARWGQLRDSDPFVGSSSRRAQPNFAVAFELGVP